MNQGIYLDYAATAAVRPPEVAEAVASYIRDIGATPGRSSHARSLAAGRVALRCRLRLARLFGIPGDPGRIVMQLNATHALNTAIQGVVRPGDTVIRTTLDHNSVRRPLAALEAEGVRVRMIGLTGDGRIDLGQLDTILSEEAPRVRLVALPHASNVTAAVLPVREIAERARAAGALVLVDAAQTAGHLPFSVDDLGIDLLAFTGHKGLLGPQGTGGLWVRDGVDVAPLLRGGTGGDSSPLDMPDSYPDHLEAGTQNAPGIAGLLAGVEYLLDSGIETIRDREVGLTSRLLEKLDKIQGIRVVSHRGEDAVGIVSLLVDGWDPGRLSVALEKEFGIQGRPGLHCAPDAHAAIGTLGTGAYRLSLGWNTTEVDVDSAADAIHEIVRKRKEC